MSAKNDSCVIKSDMDESSLLQWYLEQVADTNDALREEGTREDAAHVTETVLVVDDNDALRRFVTRGLQIRGYRTLTAANGFQALHIAECHSGHIDALVTDINMPYLDGKELARRLTAIRPQLRVLFMSGCVYDEAAEVMTSGRVFLQKPFSPGQLWSGLREALDHKGDEPSSQR